LKAGIVIPCFPVQFHFIHEYENENDHKFFLLSPRFNLPFFITPLSPLPVPSRSFLYLVSKTISRVGFIRTSVQYRQYYNTLPPRHNS